jgi:hypothetical protein
MRQTQAMKFNQKIGGKNLNIYQNGTVKYGPYRLGTPMAHHLALAFGNQSLRSLPRKYFLKCP